MKNLIYSSLVLLILMGCAIVPPSGHSITGPDGSENELVSCHLIDGCYNFARQICGGTYKIVNSNSDAHSVNRYTETDFIILVKCDSGKATYPQTTTVDQKSSSASNTGDEFPNAHTFKDCEQYELLYKNRCREEVYAKAHPPGTPQP